MIRRTLRSTRSDALVPYTTLFRSGRSASDEFGQRNLTSLPTGHIETLELGRRRLLCSRHIGPDRNGIALRIDMRAPDSLTIVAEAQDISDISGRYAGKCRFFTVWHEAPLRHVAGLRTEWPPS